MDTKTLLLGIIPPVMAFLAEARKPVSAEVIRQHARLHAGQHVPEPTPTGGIVAAPDPQAIGALATELVEAARRTTDTKAFLAESIPLVLDLVSGVQRPGTTRHVDSRAYRDNAVEALATTITAIAETAVEVGGIIPTWISITAASAAVLLEVVDVTECLLILLVFTLLSSLFGIPLFQRINYRDAAMIAPPGTGRFPCGATRRVDCISWIIKAANLTLALLVLAVWCATNFHEIRQWLGI